jgi:hypothetical protein
MLEEESAKGPKGAMKERAKMILKILDMTP